MDINTKTITTKVHAATFSADDIKAVALSAVKGKVGVVDANVVSSQAAVAADGSVSVEIVESVPDAAPQDGTKIDDSAPSDDVPAPAPAFVPGFAKAA